MTTLALSVSICLHVFFFVGVLGDRNSNQVFSHGQALRLAAIQFLGAIAILGAMFGQDGAGEAIARWLTVPVLLAQVYGFLVFRMRQDAPKGTPALRLFEDALYAAHVFISAAALLLAVWLKAAALPA